MWSYHCACVRRVRNSYYSNNRKGRIEEKIKEKTYECHLVGSVRVRSRRSIVLTVALLGVEHVGKLLLTAIVLYRCPLLSRAVR